MIFVQEKKIENKIVILETKYQKVTFSENFLFSGVWGSWVYLIMNFSLEDEIQLSEFNFVHEIKSIKV